MNKFRILLHALVTPFVSPSQTFRAMRSVPWFCKSLAQYRRMSSERVPMTRLVPCLNDRYEAGGTSKGEYFYQDFWAARKVLESGVKEHVDVASRVDGFVAHCALFTRVTYVDIRPIETSIPTIIPKVGSLLNLPFADRSIQSLSCLHVIEHIGLGRYGDPLDPQGSVKSINELQRILAPGGQLYIGLPVGTEQVHFNSMRVHNARTIPALFSELALKSFSVIDTKGELIDPADIDEFSRCEYALGLYHFERPAA